MEHLRAGLDEAASWGLFCLLDRHAGERLGAEVALSLLDVRTQTMGFPDATVSRGRLRPGQNVSIKKLTLGDVLESLIGSHDCERVGGESRSSAARPRQCQRRGATSAKKNRRLLTGKTATAVKEKLDSTRFVHSRKKHES